MKDGRQKIRKSTSFDGNSDDKNGQTKKNYNDSDALTLCQKARSLWLQKATDSNDLDDVEALYRRALNAKREIVSKTHSSTGKKRERDGNVRTRKTVAALSPEEYRKAGERLSLLYLQSGRPYKATLGLKYLGFECRLSEKILNYPTSAFVPFNTNYNAKAKHKKKNESNNLLSQPPCCVVDRFLSPNELNHLRKVFGDVESTYWTSHNYIIDKEPPAPYFSYVIDLKTEASYKQSKRSFLRKIIDKILLSEDVKERFSGLRRGARYVELWAHNRPHASGHQLHFDSDDEGRSRNGGFPTHPICSTVLNLSSHSRVGGPTLVTNQRLRNPATTNLQSVRGWLVPSKPSRLICFDGSVLHGVVPGKGVIPEPQQVDESRPRRVTLMMAFWKDIQIRKGTTPGSARPWPTLEASPKLPPWAKELNRTDAIESEISTPLSNDNADNPPHGQIISVHRVYELLDGSQVPKYKDDGSSVGEGFYMPEYDKVFQGF